MYPGFFCFIVAYLIQPVCAATSSQETGSRAFFELTVLAILIPGFFIAVVYSLYWAGKRSSSSVREKLIESSDIPEGSKVITLDSPFFLLYFSTALLFCAFFGFFLILMVLSIPDPGTYILQNLFFFSFPIIILITSTLFIYHPLRKVIRSDNNTDQDGNAFYYVRFFVIIGFCFLLFFGLSGVFDTIASHSNPHDGRCDICGEYASYQYTINAVGIHEYCSLHGLVFVIFHPSIPMENTSQQNSIMRIISLAIDLYLWGYGIGFAVLAGKRYGWSAQ